MLSSGRRAAAITALGAALALLPRSALASDVSSWFSAGSGYGLKRAESTGSYDRATTLSFAVGVGSDPTSRIVIGGLLRSTTYLSLGTDLGVAARVASGGFVRGQWGIAADIGPIARLWRGAGDYGRFPLAGLVTVGAPFGFQLAVGGEFLNLAGSPAARGAVALLEIDFLRLTLMRQGATDRYWENPSPAGGRIPSVTPFP